jgi:hypothetical protein
VLGTRNVWAFGFKGGTHGRRAFTMHDSGSGWTPLPAPGSVAVVDASAVSRSDIWAVEGANLLGLGTGKGALIHWSAGRWHALALPGALASHPLDSLKALSDRNVWVGGAARNGKGGTTEAVGHWNGRRWTVTTMKVAASRAKYATIALVPDGRGGLWAAEIRAATPGIPAARGALSR